MQWQQALRALSHSKNRLTNSTFRLYDRQRFCCRHHRLPEVDHSLIVLGDENRPLGRGAYGHVYFGRLHNVDTIASKQSSDAVEVAVKIALGISLVANKRLLIDRGRGRRCAIVSAARGGDHEQYRRVRVRGL